jgi:acetyltransferase-like isoleucine patch superfamily enzyme
MNLRALGRFLLRDVAGFNGDLRRRVSAQLKFPSATIAPTVVIRQGKDTTLSIGRHTTIADFTVITLGNDENNAGGVRSGLYIGDDTYIGEQNNLRAGGGVIRIGNKCLLSQAISVIASNHSIALRDVPIRDQPWDTTHVGVTIEDDVWIGCNAVLLPGVRVGRGAVVAAGSVVTRDVPDYTIVGGVPAKVLKQR